MGRPREFDEDKVLDAALCLFWERGYDGASMDDVIQATGLARASIYGAFGGKEQLFARVLDRYIEQTTARDEVDPRAGPRKALEALMRSSVEGTCPSKGPKGCFLTLAGTQGDPPDFVRDLVLRVSAKRQHQLEKLIAEGQESGDFPTGRSPASLARFLFVVQQGIASGARAGMSHRALGAVMREALEHVTGGDPPTRA